MIFYAVTIEYISESGVGVYSDKITYPNCTLQKNGTFTRTKRIPTIHNNQILMTQKTVSVLEDVTNAMQDIKIVDIEIQKTYFHID